MTSISGAGSQGENFTKITIQKGKGITHALLDLVKKTGMVISDGSISKAEWNATIKTLDEIQQNRKANNQNSIFGKNYLVHTGQEIDFTEDEINMLYKSMGVSFKNQPQEVEHSENQETENSASVSAGENSNSDAVQSEQVSQTIEEEAQVAVQAQETEVSAPVESDNNETTAVQAQTSAHGNDESIEDKRSVVKFDIENGREKYESEIGRTIVMNDDGSKTFTYEYQTVGGGTTKESETIRKNPDGTVTVLRSLGADGSIDVSFTIDANGRHISTSEFSYNKEKGLMIEEKTLWNKDLSYTQIKSNNENGKEVSREEFEFDSSGLQVARRLFGPDNQLIARQEYSYYPEGTCGEGWSPERQTLIYDKDNNLSQKIEYTYEPAPDSSGQYIRIETTTDMKTGKVEVVRSDEVAHVITSVELGH